MLISASQSGYKSFVKINEQDVLSYMFDYLWNQLFMIHHAQDFDQASLVNAYSNEESKFVENIKTIWTSGVGQSSNIFGIHIIYKLKLNDDHLLKLMARIAIHGNGNFDKENLRMVLFVSTYWYSNH